MVAIRSLIINTTFVVDPLVEERFLGHLATFYIPKAIATGVMQKPRLHRILHANEDGSVSYALQFSVDNSGVYQEWWTERGEKLQRMTANKFGHSVVGFVTQMEEVAL